jgi:hypothetical protein
MTDPQWAAIIAKLSAGQSDDAATEAAAKAFMSQLAYEAVRTKPNGHGNGTERRV